MIRAILRAALPVACAILPASQVFAHITLDTREARVGSQYKAVLRVPHGCAGSPTTRVRVRIPDGVIGVKPQPKPGWKLETIKADYAKPHKLYHVEVSSGVREISWSGGRLPDDHYDEFVFIAYLSDTLSAPGTLYFPVVQECEKGVARWIDRPGQGGAGLAESPAPALKLLPRP